MIIYVVGSLIAFMWGITYSDRIVDMLAFHSFLELCVEVFLMVYWVFTRRKGKAE